MKAVLKFKTLAFFLCAFLTASIVFGQEKKPASPHTGVMGTAAGAKIAIRYGAPYVKGRKVWGELEPFGKVYRAGADSATTVTIDKDVKVEGKALPAGKYSFFVIPQEKGQWTVIFNKVAEQWGAYKYDEAQDQLRVMVTPKKIAKVEQLKYVITSKGFSMDWDEISVPVKITK